MAVLKKENTMISSYDLRNLLLEKGKDLKVDLARINAVIKQLENKATLMNKNINIALSIPAYSVARKYSSEKEKVDAKIEPLEKLKWNLKEDQKAVGKAIVKLRTKEYNVKTATEILEILLRKTPYQFRHYVESSHGW